MPVSNLGKSLRSEKWLKGRSIVFSMDKNPKNQINFVKFQEKRVP